MNDDTDHPTRWRDAIWADALEKMPYDHRVLFRVQAGLQFLAVSILTALLSYGAASYVSIPDLSEAGLTATQQQEMFANGASESFVSLVDLIVTLADAFLMAALVTVGVGLTFGLAAAAIMFALFGIWELQSAIEIINSEEA